MIISPSACAFPARPASVAARAEHARRLRLEDRVVHPAQLGHSCCDRCAPSLQPAPLSQSDVVPPPYGCPRPPPRRETLPSHTPPELGPNRWSAHLLLFHPTHRWIPTCPHELWIPEYHTAPGCGHTAVKHSADQTTCLEVGLSLIHISEPTRLRRISYAVFCLK